MYSVMIVEDELLVRMGLKVSIPWDTLDMLVVADCSDGLTALEQYKKIRPNIIITDIRMPGMDGLSLIREIRKTDPDCAIVIITCLEDFYILHEAMKYDISDYLLKATMTQEEIVRAMDKVRLILTGKQRCDEASAIKRRKDQVLYDLLSSFLAERVIDCGQFLSQCHTMDIRPAVPAYLMIAYVKRDQGYQELLYNSIREIIQGKLNALWEASSFLKQDYMIFLIYSDIADQTGRLREHLAEINEYVKINFNTSMLFALRKLEHGFEGAWKAMDECMELFAERSFKDSIFVNASEALPDGEEIALWLQNLRGMSWRYGFISQPDRTRYDILLDQLESAIKAQRQYGDPLIALVNFMAKVIGNIPQEELSGCCRLIRQALDCRRAIAAFNQFIVAYSAFPRPNAHSREICRSIDYMQSNIQDDITLTDIASKVNLSPNYFSCLFKQETGLSFTDFLSRMRIEHAKHLLRTTNLMINEISAQCGFSDIAYFSRFFKHVTGANPSSWREKT